MNITDYPDWIHLSEALYCAAPGCQLNPDSAAAWKLRSLGLNDQVARLAVEGTDLCNYHHSAFKKALVDLVGLWPLLEQALYRGTAAGEENQKVQKSGITDLSQVWNPQVTETMGAIADWTGYLVRLVVREHSLPVPYIRQPINNVKREHARERLASLAKHDAGWLSQYPSVGASLLVDANGFVRDAIDAIDSKPVRRVGLNTAVCGHVVEDIGFGELKCLAPMVGILGQDGKTSRIVCSIAPKSHRIYTRDEWMRLGE